MRQPRTQPPPYAPPLTDQAAEALAREEARVAVRNALALGCCPECWELLTRVDGRWACLACRWEEEIAHG